VFHVQHSFLIATARLVCDIQPLLVSNSVVKTTIKNIKERKQDMSQHRIICTNQEPAGQPPTHAHIVAVGIGTTADRYDQRLSLDQVLSAMDRGEVFYTKGEQSGKVALVEKAKCPNCVNHVIIRSAPDAVRDNNLDSLTYCRVN
jgi:hypothetical protein